MTDSKPGPTDIPDPSAFAPKSPAKFKRALTADQGAWVGAEDLSLGGNHRDPFQMGRGLRFPPSLEPVVLPEPPPSTRRHRSLRLVALLGFGAVTAGLSMILMLWGHDEEQARVWAKPGKTSLLSRLSALVASDARPPASSPAPRLVVTSALGDLQLDKVSALGVTVYGPADGAELVVGGYAAGSGFSVGQPFGENAWTFPAAEIEKATLVPPQGFVGVMNIAITLVLPNGAIADRRTVHLKWLPDTTALRTSEPSVSRQIAPEEVDALTVRGDALVSIGNLAGARLLYQRAAEAGNARAAFALAEMYDPFVLKSLGEWLTPNVAMARTWYKKAKDLGSREAFDRLERLQRRSE
jgi:hypothetical protein